MKNNNISRKNRLKSKKQAPANYLIVCEGKKTEPNYFNGLKKEINKRYGKKVDEGIAPARCIVEGAYPYVVNGTFQEYTDKIKTKTL